MKLDLDKFEKEMYDIVFELIKVNHDFCIIEPLPIKTRIINFFKRRLKNV